MVRYCVCTCVDAVIELISLEQCVICWCEHCEIYVTGVSCGRICVCDSVWCLNVLLLLHVMTVVWCNLCSVLGDHACDAGAIFCVTTVCVSESVCEVSGGAGDVLCMAEMVWWCDVCCWCACTLNIVCVWRVWTDDFECDECFWCWCCWMLWCAVLKFLCDVYLCV